MHTLRFLVDWDSNCAHVRGVFGGFLDQFGDEGLSEGGVQVVNEVFLGHLYNLREYI